MHVYNILENNSSKSSESNEEFPTKQQDEDFDSDEILQFKDEPAEEQSQLDIDSDEELQFKDEPVEELIIQKKILFSK